MRSPWAWLPLLIAMFMASCGHPQTEDAAESVELESQSEELASVCEPSQLDATLTWTTASASNEACDGEWSYHRYSQCQLTDSRCGMQCPAWNTCRNWSFGRDSVDQKLTRDQGMTQIPRKCTERCVRRVFGVCVDYETTCVVDSAWALAKCAQWAEDYRSMYYNHGNYVGSSVDYSTMFGYTPIPGNKYSGTCRYRLSIPQARERADSLCGCSTAYQPRTCMLYDQRCGAGPYRTSSSMGLTATQADNLVGSHPADAPWDPIEGVSTAGLVCTSCENLMLPASPSEAGVATKIQSKSDCLTSRRSFATPAAALITDRNRVLLYERWGSLLTPGQRQAARPLYEALPNLPNVNSCGNEPNLPTLPFTCPAATATKLMGDLRRCQRLTDTHVGNSLRSMELTSCTAALDAIAANPACGAGEYPTFQASSVANMLVSQFALLASDPTGLGTLQNQLLLIDAWYRSATAAHVRPSDEELERVLTEFRLQLEERHAAFDVLTPALGGAAGAIQTALRTAEQGARTMDQQLLAALFTPVSGSQLPLTGVPLAQVAGEALTSLSKRVDDLASYHDFACSFAACDASMASSPVLLGFRLLAALDDATALQSVLASSSQTLSGYTAVFQQIRVNHAQLLAALSDPAASRTALSRIVASAKARFGNFQREGRFRGMKADLLHAGLTENERAAVISAVQQSVNRLSTTTNTYDSALQTLFASVMGQLASGADGIRVSGEIALLAQQVDDLGKDLAGLQQNTAAGERKFSRAMIEHQIADQLSSSSFFQLGETQRFDLNGTSGKYNFAADPNHTGPVAELAVGAIENLAQGQMLMIETSGSYAPTCSLRRLSGNILPPNGNAGVPVNVAGSLTGPEGFTVSFSNGSYSAESSSSSVTTTAGVKTEMCAGGGAPGFSANSCAYVGKEWSWSDSESDGEETRTSASFMSGLRLKNTPFPNQATGALLVVLAHPTTGVIQDVRAVHAPQTAIFVPHAATAYLVVNDERDVSRCTNPDLSHVLSVSATPMVSGPGAAQLLSQAMSTVLASVRAHQSEFLAQGRILPAELEAVRLGAINALSSTLDIETLPLAMQQIFEEFLSAELGNLQRRVEILSVERQRTLLLAQIRTLHKILVNTQAHSHLAKQLPQRMLRRLSARVLERDVSGLQVVVEEYLEPVLELWYPRVYERLEGSVRIGQLLALDLDSELEDAAVSVHDLVDEVLQELTIAQLGYKGTGSTLPIIAVSFVKPGTPLNNPVTGQRQVSNLRKVDAGRATDLWDAIEGRTQAQILLRPEDIYGTGANRTDFTLSCAEHVPVVYKMAGYFSGSAEDVDGELNGLSRAFDAYPSTGQSYADESGLLPYQLVNDVWTRMDMPILYGTFTNLTNVFNTDHDVASQRPVGLSPFGQYGIDFSTLDAIESSGGLTGTDGKFEFILLMQVDSRPAGQNLPWVSTCQ